MGYINVELDNETHLRLNLVCKAIGKPIKAFVPEHIKAVVDTIFREIKEGKHANISEAWVKIVQSMG